MTAGDLVNLKNVSLPKGSFIKIQPHITKFIDIANPKAVLETALRNFTCLTEVQLLSPDRHACQLNQSNTCTIFKASYLTEQSLCTPIRSISVIDEYCALEHRYRAQASARSCEWIVSILCPY